MCISEFTGQRVSKGETRLSSSGKIYFGKWNHTAGRRQFALAIADVNNPYPSACLQDANFCGALHRNTSITLPVFAKVVRVMIDSNRVFSH